MCGFAGFFQQKAFSAETGRDIAEKMALQIAHRGPDDSGVWLDVNAGIGLSHRRLSILELSAAGHQPMVSDSGRYVIAFNGEIYNHLDLRLQLGECAWRGHADTETLLAGFEAWGIEATLKKSVGMFAFALWDRDKSELCLARDRMGEKPLYYGWQGDVFLFGSELKALKAHPAFRTEINRDSLTLLLRHNYIPAPYSIFQGIRKLPPASYLKITADMRDGEPASYWSLREVVERGLENPFSGNEAEAIEMLESLLRDVTRIQRIADVPLGAFLSGGVDSSAIVALMQTHSGCPVKTFTIGFHERKYNEAEYAKAVASHLGTEHTELYVTPEETMNVVPRLPTLYDEPFSDSSQIPTFLISQLAKKRVTVALSGDGGDELFGGYNRYLWAALIWRKLGSFPFAFRKMAAGGLKTLSPGNWDRLYGLLSALLPKRLQMEQPGDKAHKLSEVIPARSAEEIYWRLVSHWKNPAAIVRGAVEPPTALTEPARWPQIPEFERRMMYLDAISYLPDDGLVKVERAAMGVSLETRTPFLDHRVVEFAWQLPLSMKIRAGKGKWILRQVLYKHVPKDLIERPKMGFGIPLDAWLRGPMREWAEALLNEARLKREGFFHPTPIRRKWQEHLSGRRNWSYLLWDVLMFQAWQEANS